MQGATRNPKVSGCVFVTLFQHVVYDFYQCSMQKEMKKLQAVATKKVSIMQLRREYNLERQKNVELTSDKRKLVEQLAATIKTKNAAVRR